MHSKVSDKMSEAHSPTADLVVRTRELEDDDLYSIIEPNDILDLPRVGFKNNQSESCLIICID
jgi:hypothetical protein